MTLFCRRLPAEPLKVTCNCALNVDGLLTLGFCCFCKSHVLWTLLPRTSHFEFRPRIQMDSAFFRPLQQFFKDPYTVVHGPIMDAAFSHLTI